MRSWCLKKGNEEKRMKKLGLALIIFVIYCFPFVFIALYMDFAFHTMAGYALMLAVTFILAYAGKITDNLIAVIGGNLASLTLSYYLMISMPGDEHWRSFFKPLTPEHLLVLVSCLHWIPQLIAVSMAGKYNKR
jgi:hypothetical protein